MRYLGILLSAALMMATGGSVQATDKPFTIAVFTKNNTNPGYEAFRIGADKVARSMGAKTVHFVPKKPDDVDEQKAHVEQVLKDKPDIVLFVPVDDKAMIDSVKKLNDAKIPVVLFTNPLPGQFVTYVGADDVEIGYKEAKYLFQHLGRKGKIVVIEGQPVAPTNRDRLRGYERAFAEFPDIQVIGKGIGYYQQTAGKTAMAKLLQEHPQIDAVLSANDSMALGVLEALKEANRSAVVIGINGIPEAVKQIGAGTILASVDFNMFKIGCMSAHAAARYLKKEALPEKVMLPAEVIDKTNYQEWMTPLEQRPCPGWIEAGK